MTLPAPDRARTFLSIVLAATALGAVELAGAQQGAATPAPATKAAAPAKPKAAAEKDDKSAASYSLGVIMGSQLHSSGVRPDDVSAERVEQGFRDALSGKVKLGESDKTNVNKLLHSAYDSLAENNHKAAEKFLAENGKKPDVTTTASGLEYKVLSAGNGATPKPTDQVVVNYRGSLVDGTEFDRSSPTTCRFLPARRSRRARCWCSRWSWSASSRRPPRPLPRHPPRRSKQPVSAGRCAGCCPAG
jgi:FKBP-type peptidyl-prolyl cis-trans isomerase